MNKRIVWIWPASIIALTAVGVIAISADRRTPSERAAMEPIVIGHMSGLTGEGSDIGTEESNGARLAVEQVNSRGGISGRALQMIAEDAPPFDLKKGASVAEKLISVDQAIAIIGPQWDSLGELMASVSARRHVPVISQNVSTDIESKVDSPYFFVTWPDDEIGIQNLLAYARSRGWKRIAIIEPANFSFWLFTSELLKKNAPSYGIQIVGAEMGSDFGDVDYRTLISKAKVTKPDAVFGSYAELECVFLRQMLQQKLDVPFLSTDSAGSPKALSECPDLMEGRLYYAAMSKVNGYDVFALEYAERFGREPASPSAATAYNAVMVLAEALKEVAASGDEVNRENVQRALREVDYKDAVSIGEIRFNDKGYAITPPGAYEIRTVKDGRFILAE